MIFLLLPLYTRYLSVSEYGYYDIITTTIYVIIPIVTLQITEGLYRFVIDTNDEQGKIEVISNAFRIITKNVILFDVLYFVVYFIIPFKFGLIILIQINLAIFAGMMQQISRGKKDNLVYSISGLIATFITLISNIILIMYVGLKIEGLIISNILGFLSTIVFIQYKLKIIRNIKYSLENIKIKKMLYSYSIPLIPTGIGWWIINVSDRYMLNYYLGIEANGLYGIANKFPAILLMVSNLFYLAWQEISITEYNSEDRDSFYSKMFNFIMILQLTVVIVLIANTKTMFRIIIHEEFFSAWKYVPFLYMGTVFSTFSSFYGIGYQVAKQTKGAFYTSIVGCLVNIGVNLFLIPILGIQGASFSTMAGFISMWIIRVYQTKKYFNIHINKGQFVSFGFVSTLLTQIQ